MYCKIQRQSKLQICILYPLRDEEMGPSGTAVSNGRICDHDLPTQLALITDGWIPHNPEKITQPE